MNMVGHKVKKYKDFLSDQSEKKIKIITLILVYIFIP